MAENTAQAACTDAEWEAARAVGLLFADLGSTAQERAIHAFAEAMRSVAFAAGFADGRAEAEMDRRDLLANEGPLNVAYAEGRQDQYMDDGELLRWAYSKLHHASFTNQDDALMQDRFKLLLEHGVRG